MKEPKSTAEERENDLHSIEDFRTGVPRLYENALPEDPTVGPCIGSWGGPRGVGVFLCEALLCNPLFKSQLSQMKQTLRKFQLHADIRGLDTFVQGYLAHKNTLTL